MFQIKKKHKYDINLPGIKGKAGDPSPQSDSNSAVNYTSFTDSST